MEKHQKKKSVEKALLILGFLSQVTACSSDSSSGAVVRLSEVEPGTSSSEVTAQSIQKEVPVQYQITASDLDALEKEGITLSAEQKAKLQD